MEVEGTTFKEQAMAVCEDFHSKAIWLLRCYGCEKG
jgi:hypothetical protein